MYRVMALGEALIDFSPFITREKKLSYVMNPAGAPINVLACLSNMGVETSLIGCVGKDRFGNEILEFLERLQIDHTCVTQTTKAMTTLAFVQIGMSGEREFQFYRHPGADQLITEEQIKQVSFEPYDVFHFGSLSMTHEPGRGATRMSAIKAKEAGCIVSFDPNYRAALWDNEKEARQVISSALLLADIVKLSDDEAKFLAQNQDEKAALRQISGQFKGKLLMMTCGKEGSVLVFEGVFVSVPSISVDSIDTTGAGDCFMGMMLYQILQNGGLERLDIEKLRNYGRIANIAAAHVTTELGSADIMPGKEQLYRYMEQSV